MNKPHIRLQRVAQRWVACASGENADGVSASYMSVDNVLRVAAAVAYWKLEILHRNPDMYSKQARRVAERQQ